MARQNSRRVAHERLPALYRRSRPGPPVVKCVCVSACVCVCTYVLCACVCVHVHHSYCISQGTVSLSLSVSLSKHTHARVFVLVDVYVYVLTCLGRRAHLSTTNRERVRERGKESFMRASLSPILRLFSSDHTISFCGASKGLDVICPARCHAPPPPPPPRAL